MSSSQSLFYLKLKARPCYLKCSLFLVEQRPSIRLMAGLRVSCLKLWLQSLFSSCPLQTHPQFSSLAKATVRPSRGICTARHWAMSPCQFQVNNNRYHWHNKLSVSLPWTWAAQPVTHLHICHKCFRDGPAIGKEKLPQLREVSEASVVFKRAECKLVHFHQPSG